MNCTFLQESPLQLSAGYSLPTFNFKTISRSRSFEGQGSTM